MTRTNRIDKMDETIHGTDRLSFRRLTEEEFFSRLEKARSHANQGLYRDADAVVSDIRERYSL